MMEGTVSEEEIREAEHELRESVEGKDEINISYIRKGEKELVERIVKMVLMIIESPAERWDESKG